MTQVNVRDGMAANLSIGGLEFLAGILIVASTVSIVVYQFYSWKQLLPTKIKKLPAKCQAYQSRSALSYWWNRSAVCRGIPRDINST